MAKPRASLSVRLGLGLALGLGLGLGLGLRLMLGGKLFSVSSSEDTPIRSRLHLYDFFQP